MKRSLFRAAAALALVGLSVLAGCGSMGVKPLTPAQVAAIVCLPAQSAIGQAQVILATLPATDARAVKASADLTKAGPILSQMCASGATVSVTSVQAFANTALPALAEVAATLPLTAQQHQQADAIIDSAQVAVGFALAIQANAAATATSPSSSPVTTVPAAPAAASGAAVTSSSGVVPSASSSGDVATLIAKPFTL